MMRSPLSNPGNVSPEATDAGIIAGVFLKNETEHGNIKGKSVTSGLAAYLLSLKHLIFPLMISDIFKKPVLRILIFLTLSFPFRVLLDLIFGLLYRNYTIFRPVEEYLGAAVITVITLETVLLIKRKLNRFIPWEKNPLRRLFTELAISTPVLSILITLLGLAVNFFLIKAGFIKLSDEVIRTSFYLMLLVFAPAFTEFAVFLLNRWRISLAEMERYKKENAEYRFETLRTQVNPHFLFNSLNTLSSLVYEDQGKAADFIRDLSDVYRYVLENRNRETTTLAEEIRFIRSFVFLYQLRFDNKLNVQIDVDERFMNRLIAPMTLQLLVENAVKHNVVSAKKPLLISISTNEEGYITVKNKLQKKNAPVASAEIGLNNISSRYSYLSSQPVEVSETKSEFIVKVPLI